MPRATRGFYHDVMASPSNATAAKQGSMRQGEAMAMARRRGTRRRSRNNGSAATAEEWRGARAQRALVVVDEWSERSELGGGGERPKGATMAFRLGQPNKSGSPEEPPQ